MHANLKREYMENWFARINNSAKCSVLYVHIKHKLEWEYYLSHMPYKLRLALSRIRTCNHKLPIEAGRYGLRYAAREDIDREPRGVRVAGSKINFICMVI